MSRISCPAEFVCPITQEVMSDPVMISETGQVTGGLKRAHQNITSTLVLPADV